MLSLLLQANNTTKINKPLYCDVIMAAMASQITRLTTVYSIVHAGVEQGKHQRSASLAFVLGIHWWPVNSPQKWPVMRKMFPSDNVIMHKCIRQVRHCCIRIAINGKNSHRFKHRKDITSKCVGMIEIKHIPLHRNHIFTEFIILW